MCIRDRPPCISVSGENVKCLNKYAGLGLLSTGGLNSRNSSIEIEAPAAAPTTEDSEAQPVARAMLPFHACITKSHRAASHRGVAIGHIKVDRSDTLKQKSCKMHAHLYLQ